MIFSLGKSEPAAFFEVVALSGCSVVIIEVVAVNGQRQNPCSSYSLVKFTVSALSATQG
jgi:hypothetical protein